MDVPADSTVEVVVKYDYFVTEQIFNICVLRSILLLRCHDISLIYFLLLKLVFIICHYKVHEYSKSCLYIVRLCVLIAVSDWHASRENRSASRDTGHARRCKMFILVRYNKLQYCCRTICTADLVVVQLC